MADTKKITKKDVLLAIKAVAENGVAFDGVTADEVIAYVDTTIAQIEAKAAKAKAKAEEKKAEGDELRAAVEAVLTDEYQTIAQITAQVEGEDITAGKVTNRLTALCKAGLAHKDKVDVDGRKINGYAAGPAVETDAE